VGELQDGSWTCSPRPNIKLIHNPLGLIKKLLSSSQLPHPDIEVYATLTNARTLFLTGLFYYLYPSQHSPQGARPNHNGPVDFVAIGPLARFQR